MRDRLSAPGSQIADARGNPVERRHFFMREYELVFIAHPDLDENGLTDLINKVQGWITENGGELLKTDLWGKRKLAYPIRKQREGQYVLLHFKMAASFGVTLERNLRFTEPVMRFLLVAK
jgi:small subunit ribosomal protein S6